MNGLNLFAALARTLPGFEQKKVGISENGRQSVVHAGSHFQHVAPQRRVALRCERQPFGALRPLDGLDAPERFDRNKDQRPSPAVLPRNNQQMRMLRVERRDILFLFGENNRRRAR